MKKIFCLILFLTLFVSTVHADLTDGLYSYFPMENKTDILGYAKTGESNVKYTPGLIGKALNITTDDPKSMIYFGDSISDRDNTYRDVMYNSSTVNMWIYVREFDSLTDGIMNLFGDHPQESEGNGGCIDSINHWIISFFDVPECSLGSCTQEENKSYLRLYVASFDGDRSKINFSTAIRLRTEKKEIKEKKWFMITISHNASSNQWKMYVDGEKKDSLTNTEKVGKGARTRECPYSVGNRPLTSEYGYPFAGQIDELGVWNRALSEEEIKQLYNEGKGLTYPFDDDEQPKVHPLLLKYSPVIKLHPDEYYEPKEIASLMNYSDLKKEGDLIKKSPLEKKDISGLADSKDFSMDMVNVDVDGLFELPLPEDFSNFEHRLYARLEEDEYGLKHLQYFFFFPFQNNRQMNHEGDWEYVEVILNDANRIHSISYYFSFFTETYFDKSLLNFVNETHPVVYVSKGSHNTYGSVDPYNFHSVSFLPEDFAESMLFWEKLFRIIKLLDKVSETGETIYPEGFLGKNYDLVQINENTSWLDYEGRWGQDSRGLIRKGPRFPKYDYRFDNWNLNSYTAVFGETLLGVSLHSPLDIFIEDREGEKITEESEYLFYDTGRESEPEFVMLLGLKEATVNLESNEEGNFSLEVYLYDNETATGIMVGYANITNGKNTKARLEAGSGSSYALQIDYEGDGEYEKKVFPDYFITYNDFILPDKDSDNINDFEDNCLLIPNKDQEDFNNDGKGDACDNPRFYKEKAMEYLNSLEPRHRREKLKLRLAKRNLRYSLNARFWENEFRISSRHVFIREHVASQIIQDREFSKQLAKADSLIVEKELKETNLNKRQKRFINLFYERAREFHNNEEYDKAILFYMRVWVLLNKKA